MNEQTPRTRYSESEIETIWRAPIEQLNDCDWRHVFEQAITARQLEAELSAAQAQIDELKQEITNLVRDLQDIEP
ncbi:MAG: hypothetical protein NUV75_02050 [Gallionella sp.]|nr:hypothetical protein [Gallionella sp.]